VTVEENEDVSVGSLSHATALPNANPTPFAWYNRTSPQALGGEQSASSGARTAKPVGDGLLCQAGAAPTPSALLARLANPEKNQQREQDQGSEQRCSSGEGGHGLACCLLFNNSDAEADPAFAVIQS